MTHRHRSVLLSSDWSILITWPQCWALIGQCCAETSRKCCDCGGWGQLCRHASVETGLWLIDNYVTHQAEPLSRDPGGGGGDMWRCPPRAWWPGARWPVWSGDLGPIIVVSRTQVCSPSNYEEPGGRPRPTESLTAHSLATRAPCEVSLAQEPQVHTTPVSQSRSILHGAVTQPVTLTGSLVKVSQNVAKFLPGLSRPGHAVPAQRGPEVKWWLVWWWNSVVYKIWISGTVRAQTVIVD